MIKKIESIKELLEQNNNLENCTLINLNLSKTEIKWEKYTIKNTVFLGCNINGPDELLIRKKRGTGKNE